MAEEPSNNIDTESEVDINDGGGSGESLLREMRKLQLSSNQNTKTVTEKTRSAEKSSATASELGVVRTNQQLLRNRIAERRNSDKFRKFEADLKAIDLKNPYKNDSAKRGYCLLLNQKEFDENTRQNRREGTDVDADDVELIFSALGFDVGRFNDLPTVDLNNVVRHYARKDYSACDMFVMVVLSHGTEGRVYARDGDISIDTCLVDPFRGAHCKSLIGKPKLFFIQACRGAKCDRGVTVEDSAKERIPHEADILLFQSTTPGYFSWRNSQDGSWFIQALCYVLQAYVLEYDPASGALPKSLDEIIALTKQIVAVKFESNSAREDRSHMKEMPMIVSTLRKAYYFNALPKK